MATPPVYPPAPPQTTQPVLTGPSGPVRHTHTSEYIDAAQCSLLTNCGPVPTADWPLICCDGTWVVDANATCVSLLDRSANMRRRHLTVSALRNLLARSKYRATYRSTGTVIWKSVCGPHAIRSRPSAGQQPLLCTCSSERTLTRLAEENDTFTIYIDPSRFARKRQSQEALIKVNGDATIGGPLDIVLNTPPTQAVAEATVPIISTVNQTGQITGEFISVNVTLNYAGASCSDASATQSKSVDGSTLSVLVSVTNRCKGHKGLTTGQKVAIGVTVGVVGCALVVILIVVLVLRFSPRAARKYGFRSASHCPRNNHTLCVTPT